MIDASIASKWVLDEEDSALAVELMGQAHLAPDLLLLECGSAIWSRVRRRLLPRDRVAALLDALREVPVDYVGGEQIYERALVLAVELDHPIHDCTYLALALMHDLRVVTVDRRFLGAVRTRSDLSSRITTLAEAVAN